MLKRLGDGIAWMVFFVLVVVFVIVPLINQYAA